MREGLLIGLGGTILGLAVAIGANGVLLALAPPQIPRLRELAIDPRVFLLCSLASLAAALCASLIPALRAVRIGLSEGVRLEGVRHTGSTRLQRFFLIGQLSFSVLLLIGSGLLIKTLIDSITLHVTNDPSKLVAIKVSLPRENQVVFTSELERRLRSLPRGRGFCFLPPSRASSEFREQIHHSRTPQGGALCLVSSATCRLAILSTYGITRYATGLRSVEIAIRGALGATPKGILRLVVIQGTKVAFSGVLIGTVGALGFSHLLASAFFDVVHVPSLYFVIPLGFALAAALACWSAARKPCSADPADVLRTL